MAIYRLQFQEQNYEWGSVHGISDLLGIKNPDNKKIAELWLGDHHRAPSLIELPEGVVLLDQFLAEHPKHLGEDSRAAFGDHLPFLFKVLSAEKPLSLQVHPNRRQAAVGFLREQKDGIELTAFNRSYPDDNHKPELLYALTPFRALCGFRPVEEIEDNLKQINSELADRLLQALNSAAPQEKLKEFYSVLMSMPQSQQQQLISQCLLCSFTDVVIEQEIKRLNTFFPQDIGVLSPLFLNLIQLQPGEAIFMAPGTLHTYLEGTGLEVMACSDNVIRGGLTEKHQNVEELLEVVNWSTSGSSESFVLSGVTKSERQVLEAPVSDFCLSVLTLKEIKVSHRVYTATIILCLEGEAEVSDQAGSTMKLIQGQSCFVSALGGQISLSGKGRLAKVSSNIGKEG
ncbi:mannose-6-phosphate isomerase, class I [Endozoicomonas sp. OPT23]|uniref:mannose-6-phosphate isomerase, class I n=1 Tax=Endozoicomonas sp. OPT23 TaxID=2072845 RepID=UPI00129A7177|nr:mannose-6-phosphate isomerase, class I [Endozoicomonas sp. OPT23]MRI33173.1 mannose-6-phosphate isomerase, class I [Endozoicomonas sp. OPT23]